MELDTETVKRYVGGQLEVQNPNEEYLYRGEIADASVEDTDLRVRLAWNAKLEGGPNLAHTIGRWIKEDRLDYAASLEIYSVSESAGRIILNSPVIGETTVLFPRDGSKLDPSKVEGLVLEEQS